jgi:hypothetical protein
MYGVLMILVVLYGCESRSVTRREEQTGECLRVLRRIFGHMREEVSGGWRRLHYEELHNLYTSPNIIFGTMLRRMRWAGHVSLTGEIRNALKISVGNIKGRDHTGYLGVGGRIVLDSIRMLWN